MKSFIFLSFFYSFFLFSQNLPSQYYFSEDGNRLIRGGLDLGGFYNQSEIKTIYLYFDQPNFWDILHNNYCDKINIPATLIYDGQTYENVGVRFKGQTSYANTNGSQNGGGPGGGGPGGNNVDTDKKSFNIELDWQTNQNINGYETLNLNNCYQDPSFLREFIFSKLSRNYIPSVQVNFLKLMINDEDWGIYPNIQQLDKKHAGEWFFDDECTRWRAENPNSEAPGCGDSFTGGGPGGGGPGGGGPGGGGPNFGAGTSSLNFLGIDTSYYLEHYNLKKSYKNDPWQDLVNACIAIENVENYEDQYNDINEHFDLDAALWHLAVEIIFSDDDSYINKGGMDYYVYFDKFNNRILPIEYDGNTVFGNINWSPFYNENNSDFALLNKLLAIPEFRQRYLAHFRTILNQCFEENYINNLIDYYAEFINQSVYDDPKKIYSYVNFLNEVEELKEYFQERKSYLLSNDEVNQESVEFESVVYSVNGVNFSQPSSLDETLVSVILDSPDLVDQVNLYYGSGFTGHFEKVQMENNLNYYFYNIPAHDPGQYVRFYIEITDKNGVRKYNPEGAEHDVYIYQVKMNQDLFSDIVINEIMASNDFTAVDEFGEFDDWIEIYNKGNESINLSGYFLSDDLNNLTKYTFPDVILDPDQYFIVWADDDEEDQGDYNHATFKLSASGESVYLSDENLNLIDNCVFGEQQTDQGFARVPNGFGDFVIQAPSFNYNNDLISSTLDGSNNQKKLIKVIDILGKELTKNIDGIQIEIFNDNTAVKKFKLR